MPEPSATLPYFKYHPAPLATDAIKPSDVVCRSCGRARGYVYTGPVHAIEDLYDLLCPWCIADGSAARRFKAHFTDADGIGYETDWDSVSSAVVDELSHRTPGIKTWQSELWWTHCGDAGAFLGYAGREELTGKWSAAVPAIRQLGNLESAADDPNWEFILSALDPDGSVVAYVFRCLHCGALGGYWDCD